MKSPRVVLPTAVVLLVAACGDDARDVRAPAGSVVVVNEAPRLDSTRAWRLQEAPVLTIGAGDPRAAAGDTLHTFNDVVGASLLGDGRIVVADMGSSSLRLGWDAGQ